MKKRTVRILLICIVIGCVLTSVYFLWPREKQVYQHGIQYTQCPPAEENDWWGSGDSKAFQDAAAAKTVTVSWQGKQYVGEYEYSYHKMRLSYLSDNYKTADGTEFEIRRGDGALVFLHDIERLTGDEEDLPDTENAVDKIAKDFVNSIANVDEYQLKKEPQNFQDRDGRKRTVYYYEFKRMIHGRWTSDHIYLRITSKGDIIYMALGDVGAFSEVSKWKLDSFAKLDGKEMLQQATANTNVTIVEADQEIYAINPKGELVLQVLAEIQYRKTSDSYPVTAAASFIIK